MAYLVIVGVVIVAMLLLLSKLKKGWEASNTSVVTRNSTQNVLYVIAIVVSIALIVGYNSVEEKWIEYQKKAEIQKGQEKALAAREVLLNEFRSNRESVLGMIRQLQATGEFTKARAEASRFRFTEDQEIKTIIAELDAAIADGVKKRRIATLTESINASNEWHTPTMIGIYRELVDIAPDVAKYKENLAIYEKKLAIYEKRALVEAAKELQAEKARKKKSGVQIGMTMQDVKDSSWGRPRKANRTIMAYGVREQWVYDGGYLYFEGDILTSIQN